jgi:Tfp pilus assembly pilus retraction ATPase PilT
VELRKDGQICLINRKHIISVEKVELQTGGTREHRNFSNIRKSRSLDLHLSAGLPQDRLHGSLRSLKMDPLSREELRKMLDILSEEQKKRYESDLEIDLSYSVKEVARFRVNVYRQEEGSPPFVSSLDCPTPAQLNMPPILGDGPEREGLILVTGPTGEVNDAGGHGEPYQ